MKNQILKNRIAFFSKTDNDSREKQQNLLFFVFKKSGIHFTTEDTESTENADAETRRGETRGWNTEREEIQNAE